VILKHAHHAVSQVFVFPFQRLVGRPVDEHMLSDDWKDQNVLFLPGSWDNVDRVQADQMPFSPHQKPVVFGLCLLDTLGMPEFCPTEMLLLFFQFCANNQHKSNFDKMHIVGLVLGLCLCKQRTADDVKMMLVRRPSWCMCSWAC